MTTRYLVGEDLILNIDRILSEKNYSGFLILADKTPFSLFGGKILASLKRIRKPITVSQMVSGEKNKDISKIKEFIKPFFREGFNRNAALISIGGGVVTDLGGFIASMLLRGIDSIYIPTTLLAQVDAAIGGKTGVNFHDNGITYKNMLGAFKQPSLVISDVRTLSTLPKKEMANGMGEIVKYWIGWGKPEISEIRQLTDQRGESELTKIVAQCQKIKIDIVLKDQLETKGIRQKLNLGHTIGHAIEGVSGKISHGEAVSIGLVAAARLSLAIKMLSLHNFKMIIKTITSLGLPTQIAGIDKQKVLKALKLDKKGGTFVLIEDIGKLKTGIYVEEKIISQTLSETIF